MHNRSALECAMPSQDIIDSFDERYTKHVEEAKEEFGIDLKNCTQDEWNRYYLHLAEKQAETDEYFREILRASKRMIDEKDYSGLVAVYQNYDKLVKEMYDRQLDSAGVAQKERWKDLTLPFWCYYCCEASDSSEVTE